MSKAIMALYTKAGIKPPVGKGEHTYAFHKIAVGIKKAHPDYPMSRCYAIAMSMLGRNKAVKKSHWRNKNGK